jgi:hypothetical protein|tara:strand:- start:160 stop:546 length:387 start_codon:yes stop_codon:yes gene_type:complete
MKCVASIDRNRRVELILEAVRFSRSKRVILDAVTSFVIFRTDTNAVLARGVLGYEAAKDAANALRKKHGLKWDQVSFKSEKGRSFQSSRASQKSYRGGRVEYARNFNPSKGRRFSGVYDRYGNFADLD